MKLFQEKMKARMPPTTMPGRASGRATWRKACQVVAPSMRAASSSSIGTFSKYPIMIQTMIGMVITRWVMTSAVIVPTSPVIWNSRKSGIR